MGDEPRNRSEHTLATFFELLYLRLHYEDLQYQRVNHAMETKHEQVKGPGVLIPSGRPTCNRVLARYESVYWDRPFQRRLNA
jgi:hypothetical protein